MVVVVGGGDAGANSNDLPAATKLPNCLTQLCEICWSDHEDTCSSDSCMTVLCDCCVEGRAGCLGIVTFV